MRKRLQVPMAIEDHHCEDSGCRHMILQYALVRAEAFSEKPFDSIPVDSPLESATGREPCENSCAAGGIILLYDSEQDSDASVCDALDVGPRAVEEWPNPAATFQAHAAGQREAPLAGHGATSLPDYR